MHESSIHTELYKSKVYSETVYLSTSSIDITFGCFIVLVSKRRGEINRKKGSDVVSNRSHSKVSLIATRKALTACAKGAT